MRMSVIERRAAYIVGEWMEWKKVERNIKWSGSHQQLPTLRALFVIMIIFGVFVNARATRAQYFFRLHSAVLLVFFHVLHVCCSNKFFIHFLFQFIISLVRLSFSFGFVVRISEKYQLIWIINYLWIERLSDNMRLNGVAIVILLIAICNNKNSSAFITKEIIQRALEDLRHVPRQNVIWARDHKDRLHGRFPYDHSSSGQVVDGRGAGLPINTRSRSYQLPPTSELQQQHQSYNYYY